MILPSKVLILEDNEADVDLLCRELKRSALDLVFEVAQNRNEYETALRDFCPDIILSDYSLPAFDAVTAFHIKQRIAPLVPFIVVSGTIGEENAVGLINSGVTDYASKENLFSLPAKIQRALKDMEMSRDKAISDEQLKIQAAELLRLNAELEDRVATRTRALAESETRFRNMMETIPQIAWTNTVEGEVDYYNQRWYEYTGLQSSKILVNDFTTVIHPDDLKESLDQFGLLTRHSDGGEFQMRIKRADGIFRWHLIRLMNIRNPEGISQQWIGTATDIQELRILQQQKDDFISIASHELKTPITTLRASLQLLERMKDKPSALLPKLVTQANKSLEKVYMLIEDLLNTSKAHEDQLQIHPVRFNLLKIISECCDNLPLNEAFRIHVQGDAGLEVYADVSRIEQIIINFVNNAIKYAPGSKEITVSVERLAGMARISVADEGPGIPAQNLRFLFDRYYRINHGGAEYTGLGLGLYICAEIVKKHHGKIGAESVAGRGSTFWFTLPVLA